MNDSIETEPIRNQAMERMVQDGEAIDVSGFERTPEGYYRIPAGLAFGDKDLCDAKTEEWIWSVGRSPTGEFFASTKSNFYPAPEGRTCAWLR